MLITGVLCTARREPGFQWMADSVTRAINRVPGVNFELIVVDKLLWLIPRRRRQQLAEAIKGRFSYRHVTPKPTVWQGPGRLTSRDYYGLCNARNTGIALARGSHIVLLDDCSVFDENWLFCHARAATRGAAVAGSFKSYTRATVEDGRIVDGELHPSGIDSRGEELAKAPGGWLYGLNCSFPLTAALAVNGYDELYDGQAGTEDCQYGCQIELAGYSVVYFPDCLIYQILENHEAVCDWAAWGAPQPVAQKERVLDDGRGHFANEFLVQAWAKNPQVTSRGNDFDLAELRARVLSTGIFPDATTPTVDWRDGQPLKDM